MKAMLVMVTYNNGESKKVLIDSFSQLKELKEDKRNIKSMKGVTVNLSTFNSLRNSKVLKLTKDT